MWLGHGLDVGAGQVCSGQGGRACLDMSRLAQVAMRAKAVSSASGEGCVGPGGVDLSSAQSIWSELDKIPQEGTFILADIGKFIAEN